MPDKENSDVECKLKDKLSELFDLFVDEMDLLAVQIGSIAGKTDNIADKTNNFTFSQTSSHVDEIHGLIELIKSEIKPDKEIPLEEYRARVEKIDKNSIFVRLANSYVIADKNKTEAEVTHYKNIEEFVLEYRSFLLDFNSCVINYNFTRNKNYPELKPLASIDMSPLKDVVV